MHLRCPGFRSVPALAEPRLALRGRFERIGNVLLVLLNLPLIGIWVRILRIPYQVLFPMIVLFAVIGARGKAVNLTVTSLSEADG